MEKPKKHHVPRSTTAPRPGEIARAKSRTLNSCRIGALPIINGILKRMCLDKFLRSFLPARIDAAGSLRRPVSASCSRTYCSLASHSTAWASGRRDTTL